MEKDKKETPRSGANQKTYVNDNTCDRLLSIFSDFKHHTRFELKQITGMGDRTIRQCIEELQLRGHRIINLCDGRGYGYAKNEKEYKIYEKMEEKRLRSIQTKLLSMSVEEDMRGVF